MLYSLIKESFKLEKASPIKKLSDNVAGNFFTDYGESIADYGDNKIVVEVPDDIRLFNFSSSRDFIYKNNLENKHYPELKSLSNDGVFDTIAQYVDAADNGIYEYFKDNNPNIWIQACQLVAKLELEGKYDGAHWRWEDELIPEQWQIWNTALLKIVEIK